MNRKRLGVVALVGMAIFGTSAFAATNVFYSVGTNTGNLMSGTPTVTITAGVAVFSGSQPDNIGVGDEITYGSASKCFISGRTSPTTFAVQTAIGGEPSAISNAAVSSIKRAFNSLEAAVDATYEGVGAGNASHLNTTNLVSGNYVLNIACYGDGLDQTVVFVRSWTTGASNFIRIYTPYSTTEVGRSQRHGGKWETSKYILSAAKGSDDAILMIYSMYVRVEGLQVEVQNSTADVNAINSWSGSGSGEIRISHCIIKNSYASNTWCGISINHENAGMVGKIWNNAIYGFSSGTGIFANVAQVYAYNNTIHGCVYGFYHPSGIFTAKNNILQVSSAGFYGQFSGDYNITNRPETPPGSHSKHNTVATFVNGDAGDFHLASSDVEAKDCGLNLSADADIQVTDDLEGNFRTSPWDIGADDGTDGGFWARSGSNIFNVNNGSVGIGKEPAANVKLDVAGSVAMNGVLELDGGGQGLRLEGTNPQGMATISSKTTGVGLTFANTIIASADFTVADELKVGTGVGIGADPIAGLRLNVNGKIKATELEAGTITGVNSLGISGNLNVPGTVAIGASVPTATLDVRGQVTAATGGATPDNAYTGNYVSTKPAASGQHINIIRAGMIPWSVGTVYNSNSFAIGMGKGTDAQFTDPEFIMNTSGNVGIGTTNPGTYKLAVEGTIGARELVVTLDSWADFVFTDRYKLKPLMELESEIKNQGHLPGIPSEQEVKEKGFGVGEMQKKMLEKIEELTLYVIAQNKEIEKIKEENRKSKESKGK